MARATPTRRTRPSRELPRKAAPKRERAAVATKRAKSRVSARFERSLTALIAGEIRSLARLRVKDAIDARVVRRLIDENVRLVDPEVLADLVTHGLDAGMNTLKEKNRTVRTLLGDELARSFDRLLDEDPASSARAGDLVASLMRQEFMQRLFTDIVYTSIVSFNERVNPLFGRFAVGMLEDQIRGFIRLFMPMIVERATAFALSPRNQTLLFGLARTIGKRFLDVPLSSVLEMLSPAQKRQIDRLIAEAVGDATFQALSQEIALATWDSLYARVRNERVGDLLRLDAHAGWLAERLARPLLSLISQPAFLRLIAAETES